MHYLVDGYNLMFRLVDTGEDLRKARDYILDDLSEKLRFLDIEMTIIFDAAYRPGDATRRHRGNLEIIYTRNSESADDFIVEQLDEDGRSYDTMVVTSDRDLAFRSRRLGASCMSIEAFVTWLDKRYANKLRRLKQQRSSSVQKAASVEEPEPEQPICPPPEPTASQSVNECYDYYRYVFEKRLKKREE